MDTKEKAYLIGVVSDSRTTHECEDSFEELKSLAATAGCDIAGTNMVLLRQITPATFIGKGKVESLKLELALKEIDLVIFDVELSPSQNRNLEEAWGVRVIDRTGLILDIFSQHAKSKEGKLQVELAQYEYLYPRLVGTWTHFSRQRGGGVGLRGPGETQLEVDRRRVRDKITKIKKELTKVTSSREIHRKKRESIPLLGVTLVGYTNAGKSTLFNALANATQMVEDKLFATLDPKTKKLKLPSGREILLTDTVGFIHNLPHQLVEAFQSTFEEISSSDLLLHVVDGAHPNFRHHMDVVSKVLQELSLDNIPLINVMNKMDHSGFEFHPNGGKTLPVSALGHLGLDNLLSAMDEILAKREALIKLFLPHPYGGLLSNLYSYGRVISSRVDANGVFVEVSLSEKWQRKFSDYVV